MAQLDDHLTQLTATDGVRGALVSTPEGAYAGGEGSGLSSSMANDVARTVRRMTVASSTVGAPVEDLVISFGPARLLVVPLGDESILVVLLDNEKALPVVRKVLKGSVSELRRLADTPGPDGEAMVETAPEPQDEVDRLLKGELGPILNYIDARFASFADRAGLLDRDQAKTVMRTQIKEWLLCCSPSPYTFPLLLDALAQQLNDAPDARTEFMNEVQEALHYSDIWQGKAAT